MKKSSQRLSHWTVTIFALIACLYLIFAYEQATGAFPAVPTSMHQFLGAFNILADPGVLPSSGPSGPTAVSQAAIPDNNIRVIFPRSDAAAPSDTVKLLTDQYATAQQTLDVAIYSLTQKDIANGILAAKKRGVQVRVITDKSQLASNKTQRQMIAKFISAGIPVKENTHSGLMHLKVSIVDDKIVTTGSFNYTVSADSRNDENLVVINNPTLALAYQAEFNRMWANTKGFATVNN
ncbi:MAG: phospholipase D family protein [Firmicutes bacterium]|nr:phospholipase D family protein [Bacillota bacterium]